MSSLYPDDMAKEEVMKEVVRLLAPTLRRMYFERFGNEAEEKDEKKEKEQKEKEEQKAKDDEIKIVRVGWYKKFNHRSI